MLLAYGYGTILGLVLQSFHSSSWPMETITNRISYEKMILLHWLYMVDSCKVLHVCRKSAIRVLNVSMSSHIFGWHYTACRW